MNKTFNLESFKLILSKVKTDLKQSESELLELFQSIVPLSSISVSITTKSSRKDYKIYIHIEPLSGRVYVGQTCQKLERRWNKGKGYSCNKYFTNVINKHGWENLIHLGIYDGLTKEEVDEIEKRFIKFFKDLGLSLNISDGGEGRLGTGIPIVAFNYKTKEKFTFSNGYEAARELNLYESAISQCILEKRKSTGDYLFCKVGEEKKLDLNYEGLEIPVVAYNYKTKEKFTFPSCKEAAIKLNLIASNISQCMLKKIKSVGGFLFCKVGEENKLNLNYKGPRNKTSSVVAINDKTGEIIKFQSITKASKELHVGKETISKHLNQGTVTKSGFRFEEC